MKTFVFYIGSKPLPRYGFKPSPPNGCGSPLFGVHVNNFFSLISFALGGGAREMAHWERLHLYRVGT